MIEKIILTKEDEIFLQELAKKKGISKRAIYIFQHLFLIKDLDKDKDSEVKSRAFVIDIGYKLNF